MNPTDSLPPLPLEAAGYMLGCHFDIPVGTLLFTADQMRAYARAALAHRAQPIAAAQAPGAATPGSEASARTTPDAAAPHATNEFGDCPHWCKACAAEASQRATPTPVEPAPTALEQRTGMYSLQEASDAARVVGGEWLCIRFNTFEARQEAWRAVHMANVDRPQAVEPGNPANQAEPVAWRVKISRRQWDFAEDRRLLAYMGEPEPLYAHPPGAQAPKGEGA